jgi:hypothetical protein
MALEGSGSSVPDSESEDLPARAISKDRLTRVTLLLWAWSAALFTVWSLATPLWTPPDSPAHQLRAYATGNGQVFLPDPPAAAGTPYASAGVVEVPNGIHASVVSASCYVFQPEASAGCIQPVGTDETLVDYIDGVGEYLPLYYAVTGWPSAFMPLDLAIPANRVPAILIASLFMAWALAAAWSMPRAPLAMAGVLVAASPTVMYFGGVVNPNSLEITAAMGTAASLIAFLADPRSEVASVLFRRAMIAAAVMALTRMLSPLWLACFALVLLVALGRRLGPAFRRPRLAWLALPVLACGVSGLWTLTQIGFVAPAVPYADLSFRDALRESLIQIDISNLKQAIGVFGWGDTSLNEAQYDYFIIASTFLVAMTWLFLTVRRSVALALLAVLAYALPVVLQAWQWNANGPIWQGRYTLPLLVLIPICCFGWAASSRSFTADHWRRARVIVPLALAVVAYVHVRAYLALLRRNVSGVDGSAFRGDWAPLIGSEVAFGLHLALTAGALLVLVVAMWRMPADGSARARSRSDQPREATV